MGVQDPLTIIFNQMEGIAVEKKIEKDSKSGE